MLNKIITLAKLAWTYRTEIRKAYYAAAAAAAFQYGALRLDGMTLGEWAFLAVATGAAGGAAWIGRNAAPATQET